MKKFWFQSIVITVFVFSMLWVANQASDLKIFTAFDSVGQALKDFDLTNYAFAELRETPEVDDRIVLVNIGRLPRRGLAEQIQAINQYKPRIIAMDILFSCEGGLRDTVNCPELIDVMGNLMLSNAIKEAGNVILGSKLLQSRALAQVDSNEADSLEISDPEFSDYSKEGFVTLPTDATYQEDVKKCNSIFPKWDLKGEEQLAFSVQIAMQYDSVKAKKFLARNKDEELINFRGNMEVLQLRLNSLKNNDTGTTKFGTLFYSVDVDDIMRGNVLGELFKDRIVMMGYLGDYLGDSAWEDKFFTPMNKKLAGRANPDMFGLVVHANAVAMILNEDYVDELSDFQKYSVAFLVCLFTVALFIWIDRKMPMWFDALSVFIQLLEVLLISSFVIYAFAAWSWKLDLTVAIGVSALVGPCYDIFKSVQNEVNQRLAKRREMFLKKYAD
ncbi:MAG TPA: CHASE2 domain-containing protein [Cyclobacteriaceae bacterium]|nr:CHASE2 domain-containing protein [Cyclobacteriaceae bacterium]